MGADTVLDRAKTNASALVSVLVTGIWLSGLMAGQSWWLPFMMFGYIVLVPATAILFDDLQAGPGMADPLGEETVGEPAGQSAEKDTDQALQQLRDRYARGELTEEQFERKLETLLETETVEDAVDFGPAGGPAETGQRGQKRSPDRDDERFESEQA